MTTIVNSPTPGANGSDNGTGFLVGIIIIVLLVIAFFVWVLPAIRNSGAPNQINVSVPTPNLGGGNGGGGTGGGTQ